MNTLQASQTKKKPQKPVYNEVELDKPLKAVEQIGKNVVKGAANAATSTVSEMWNQILGADKYSTTKKKEAPQKQHMGGDLTPGKEVSLNAKAEAPMNYHQEIVHATENAKHRESQEIRQQVNAILYELQRLATSSKALQQEVAVVVGPSGGARKDAGVGTLNFLEWFLMEMRKARSRVENAGAWLKQVRSKKKGMIAGMKKNMSQFMSGERSVSNQTS